MGLVNPGTPFDEDGWADIISEVRRLRLMIEGGANDMNGSTKEVTQVSDEFEEIQLSICDNGTEKTMKVLGTRPA